LDNSNELESFLKKLIEKNEMIDEDELDSFYIEQDDKEFNIAFFAPLKFANEINLVMSVHDNYSDVYVTVTDGPIEDVAFLLHNLAAEFKSSCKDWGDVLELKSNLLQEHGIHGLFFSRLRFFEFFDDYSDTFELSNKEYKMKAVLFLSKSEIDAFDESEDLFYELIGEKDPVLYSQV